MLLRKNNIIPVAKQLFAYLQVAASRDYRDKNQRLEFKGEAIPHAAEFLQPPPLLPE